MKKYITILSLGVRDLKKATVFYQEVFGWTPNEHSNEDITFIELEGILLSLYPLDKLAEDAAVDVLDENGFRPFTLAHNVNSKEEVDALYEQLVERGAQSIKSPQSVFWGGYSSYVADLDGNLWEIAYNPYM